MATDQHSPIPGGEIPPAGSDWRLVKLQGADGIAIAGEAHGPPGAPVVIFMHGGGQSRSAWRGAARAAARAGYLAVSIDLRGHGDSEWAPDGDYHYSAYVRDVGALLAGLGGRVALVGASLGGRVALLAAADFPDRIAAVALADTAPRINEAARAEMQLFFAAAQSGFANVEEAAAALQSLSGTRTSGSAEKLRAHLREQDGRLHWRWDPRFAEDRFLRSPDEIRVLEESARRIATPMLIMRAERSHVVAPEHLEGFRRLVPHAEIREAPGIGHMLTGDANDAYAPLIIDFLNRAFIAQPGALHQAPRRTVEVRRH